MHPWIPLRETFLIPFQQISPDSVSTNLQCHVLTFTAEKQEQWNVTRFMLHDNILIEIHFFNWGLVEQIIYGIMLSGSLLCSAPFLHSKINNSLKKKVYPVSRLFSMPDHFVFLLLASSSNFCHLCSIISFISIQNPPSWWMKGFFIYALYFTHFCVVCFMYPNFP